MHFLLIFSSLLGVAQASDFVDTWVTTALEDTNVLAGPAHYSPSANFVQRGNKTFFEDYESRFSDDISMSHLVLYRKDEAYWKGWETEAALVIRYAPYLDPDQTDDDVRIRDDGSYVRLIKQLGGKNNNFSITGYAIDANRFRLGYSYDLTYGGRDIFVTDPKAAPGVRFQYQAGGSYVFFGAKTVIQDEAQVGGDKRNQAFYGLLAGGGFEINDNAKIELGAGSFQQGQFTNVNADSLLYGEPIKALGVSGQVCWRSTPELEYVQSAELKLYRNAPDFVKDTYITHTQLDGSGVLVQAELNYLTHNLIHPTQSDTTVLESGMAGDVQTKFVSGTTVLGLDLVYKDLTYILFNVPGLTSNFAMPEINTTPQLYGRLTASKYFKRARLAPQVGMGLMQPATYTTDSGHTYVQVSEREKNAVPAGKEATNILGAIAGVQVDASKSMVIVAEFLYTQDNNRSNAIEQEDGSTTYVLADWQERYMPGFNLMMRARF